MMRLEGISKRAPNDIGRLAKDMRGEVPNGRTGYGENTEVNLPVLLVAHLGGTKAGVHSLQPIKGEAFSLTANQPSYTYPYAPYSNVPFNQPQTYQPTSMGRNPTYGGYPPYYPFLDHHLSLPTHNYGTYDGKGDPDNFLHLFDGAIRMQKWIMLVACHMFTYTLQDSTRIWWNGKKL
ncbi:hypothetical protein Tco_0775991, partial [Tanacetum coccineum]